MTHTELSSLNALLYARIERRERQQRYQKFGEEFMKLSIERTQLQISEITKGPDESVIESARRLRGQQHSPEMAASDLIAQLESDLVAVKSRTEALRIWRDSL